MQRGFLAALLLLVACLDARASSPHDTLLRVLIISGAPGHSSVHLEHNGRQLYWDPGGAYGSQPEACLEYNTEQYCQRFDGFPWDRLKAGRRNDVFVGDEAELMRVLSIYHLESKVRSQIFTFHLTGEMARRAWQLLIGGAERGDTADFDTDREPMFCVKGVSEYLRRLGGRFADMPRPWFPKDLGKEMRQLGATTSEVFTLYHPEVQGYIQSTRLQAGLNPFVEQADTTVTDYDPLSFDF